MKLILRLVKKRRRGDLIMERAKVESSNIKSIGFQDNVLEVEFKSGGVYRYSNVGEEVFRAFMDAESKGKYFHQYIKSQFSTERIDEIPKAGRRLKDIEYMHFEEGRSELMVYSDTLRKELKNWIKIYSEDDGREGTTKECRQAIIAFIKYFMER